nr:XdhC family protein [Cryptosporangium phraense]
MTDRVAELVQAREPFVKATVVRAGKPASAHAGDTALVLADGVIEGFVGGSCAESSVRVHALAALGTGDPLLLRISAGAPSTVVEEGAVTVANPCLSGGSLEIFLEPQRPQPRLVVLGDTPIGSALAALGAPLGFLVESGGAVAGADAVVVASHGHGEEPVLEEALRAGVPYVGLVASRRRGAAVVASLEVTDADRARVHYPAGLDLGGRTAPEAALSILAEIVALRSTIDDERRTTVGGVSDRAGTRKPTSVTDRPADSGPVIPPGVRPIAVIDSHPGSAYRHDGPEVAIDPICGMTVAMTEDAIQAPGSDGGVVYFCAEGCRRRYLAGRE